MPAILESSSIWLEDRTSTRVLIALMSLGYVESGMLIQVDMKLTSNRSDIERHEMGEPILGQKQHLSKRW